MSLVPTSPDDGLPPKKGLGGEFNDEELPLAVGSVTGLRTFRLLHPDQPVLWAAAWPVEWKPGENTAIHYGGHGLAWALALAQGKAYKQEEHNVAGANCTCGFYAYFDDTNTYNSPGLTVPGIIEGYGRTTIGTKGFRAAKAKIVALVDPEPFWATVLRKCGMPPLRAKRLIDQISEAYEVPVYPNVREAIAFHPTARPEW